MKGFFYENVAVKTIMYNLESLEPEPIFCFAKVDII